MKLLSYTIGGQKVGIDIQTWNDIILSGNTAFLAIADNGVIPSNYTDISSFTNWDRFGGNTTLSQGEIKGEIVKLVPNEPTQPQFRVLENYSNVGLNSIAKVGNTLVFGGVLSGTTFLTGVTSSGVSITTFNAYTGTTAPATYLGKTAFNTYSGNTNTTINSKAAKTSIATYTGTTAPAQFANRTSVNTYTGNTQTTINSKASQTSVATYTGTTAPAAFLGKTAFNTYSGNTNTTINSKASQTSIATYTGTTLPANYYNKTQINAYSAATLTNINSRLITSAFNTYSGNTNTTINSKAAKTSVATYTGTTAPNQFAFKTSVATYTGTTAPATFAYKTSIATYTGTTAPAQFANRTSVNTYTGNTQTTINSKASQTSIATYTGTTAPAAFLGKSAFNTYSGNTNTTINSKAAQASIATYTGTTAPNQFSNKTSVNAYTGNTQTTINSKAAQTSIATYTGTTAPAAFLGKSAFNTYSGNTNTTINGKASQASIATYTGTTAPATYLGKTAFNTYSGNTNTTINSKASQVSVATFTGTTLPANYYNKTQIIAYTGVTNTLIGLKAPITSPTFLVSAIAPTPAANNNSTCIATTAYYFGQCGTTAPLMNGVAAVGTSSLWAHQDHVHPRDTTKAFLTGATFTGVVNVNAALSSSCYFLGSDLSLLPIANNQSALSSWWGLQLRGLYQADMCTTPVAVGNCDSYSVIIKTDCLPTVSTLTVVASAAQTAAIKLQTWQTSALATVAAIDCTGYANFARVCSSGAITGATAFLTTTPPAGNIQQPTLFWDATTKQIEAKQLTGGSDQYFYNECTVTRSCTTTTCINAHGYCPTLSAGRYQIDFNAQYGQATLAACTFGVFKVDNVSWGGNFLFRACTAGSIFYQSFSRDITLTGAQHCFDIYYWNQGGTACVPISSIRVKRIC